MKLLLFTLSLVLLFLSASACKRWTLYKQCDSRWGRYNYVNLYLSKQSPKSIAVTWVLPHKRFVRQVAP